MAMEKNMDEGFSVYEAGFHIVPLVAEENVLAEVSKIKSEVLNLGGIFISEEFPKSRPLAYTIGKIVAGSKHNFDRAYFGWVKFEMVPSKIGDLKIALDKNEHILRHLLIHTTKETPMTYSKIAESRMMAQAERDRVEKPVSAEELDKSIDKLVTD
jgi:ribosomal protein S6